MSTFHNCGHSSIENFLRNQPMRVTLGSPGILNAVDLLFKCIREGFNSSALSSMERNL